MTAFNAFFASLHAVLQIEGDVCRYKRWGQFFQQTFCSSQRQLGVNGIVFRFRLFRVDAQTRNFGQENKFVSLQFNGHAGGHFFHRQIKSFAGWRETKWRK